MDGGAPSGRTEPRQLAKSGLPGRGGTFERGACLNRQIQEDGGRQVVIDLDGHDRQEIFNDLLEKANPVPVLTTKKTQILDQITWLKLMELNSSQKKLVAIVKKQMH